MRFGGEHARARAPYRDDGHWPPPVADRPASDEDVARFLAVYPDATCSPKTLRTLAALMRDHTPEKEGADAPDRTPGDSGSPRQP